MVDALPSWLLPEWVPNLHPLIVHFPIAILVLAPALDALALALRKRWPHGALVATGLYVVGGLSAVVTYYSGTWAVGTVSVSTVDAAQTFNVHQTWGWYTMLSAGGYALVRGSVQALSSVEIQWRRHLVLAVLGLAILWPLWKAGENGGRLVYQHGVGVETVEQDGAPLRRSTRDEK